MDQVPPIRDYSMKNRTYRYLEEEPLYPFGYGLSYTEFEYTDLVLSKSSVDVGESMEATITVTNKGDRAGDEVVQLYVKDQEASVVVPQWDLRGFKRIPLAAGCHFQQGQFLSFFFKNFNNIYG